MPSRTAHVDVTSGQFKADPFPYYARLRAEAPVHYVALARNRGAWLITRYADVASALKDDRFVKDPRNALTGRKQGLPAWTPRLFKTLERNMLDLDPPDHTRLRGLVHKAFTPRLVEAMREQTQLAADSLLDRVIERGQTDLIRDYALPLPITIITRMLGVPDRDRHKFHRWSQAIVAVTSGTDLLRVLPHVAAFLRFVRRLVRQRREEPGDDLITALIQAEEAGEQLSEDELLAMIFLLLVAGHETTVNLIGNGTLALLEHPTQRRMLLEEPSLIGSAVEELLRYTSPVEKATERYAREDVHLHRTVIPRGAMVLAVLASANRDADFFTDPDECDLARQPNRHLAFGGGRHYCLGAALARLEGQIAIQTLLRRLPDARLPMPMEALRWRPGLVLRGLESLPLRFSPRRASQ